MSFVARAEHELTPRSDEELLAHLHHARAAGAADQVVLTVRILVFGHWSTVKRRIALKVPSEDVEAVASDVVYSAIRGAFDGRSVGEFKAWLNTLTNRRIADYHRQQNRQPVMVAIGGDADDAGSAPEPYDHDDSGLVATQDIVARVLNGMNERHVDAVNLHLFGGLSARETGARLSLRPDNVSQITARFRRAVRAELDGVGR